MKRIFEKTNKQPLNSTLTAAFVAPLLVLALMLTMILTASAGTFMVITDFQANDVHQASGGLTTIPSQWASVPVASLTVAAGSSLDGFDLKDLRVCNDSTNLYFLLEIWSTSLNPTIYTNTALQIFLDLDDNPNTGNIQMAGVGSELALETYEGWNIDCFAQTATTWNSHDFGTTVNGYDPAWLNGANYAQPYWAPAPSYFYEYAVKMSLAVSGVPLFPPIGSTINIGARTISTLNYTTVNDTIPAFSYTIAADNSTSPSPGNPTLVQVSGGSLSFSVNNSSGTYVVQVSTNLAVPNGWTPIYTNTAPFTFTDPTPVQGNGLRFYRTVSQ